MPSLYPLMVPRGAKLVDIRNMAQNENWREGSA